jgi:hypothetical protein
LYRLQPWTYKVAGRTTGRVGSGTTVTTVGRTGATETAGVRESFGGVTAIAVPISTAGGTVVGPGTNGGGHGPFIRKLIGSVAQNAVVVVVGGTVVTTTAVDVEPAHSRPSTGMLSPSASFTPSQCADAVVVPDAIIPPVQPIPMAIARITFRRFNIAFSLNRKFGNLIVPSET